MDTFSGLSGTIRKLFAADLPAFRAHLLRLDPASRHSRFIGVVTDAYLADYADRCLASRGLVFGYVEGGIVRGAAELQPFEIGGERRAEAAFSVERGWRRRGIGSALFARLIVSARNRGAAALVVNCMSENGAMRALARRFSAEIVFERGDLIGTIKGLGPTPFSLAEEMIDDAHGLAMSALDYQRRFMAPSRAPN